MWSSYPKANRAVLIFDKQQSHHVTWVQLGAVPKWPWMSQGHVSWMIRCLYFSMQLASFTGFQMHSLLLSQELPWCVFFDPHQHLHRYLFHHVAKISAKSPPMAVTTGLLLLSTKRIQLSRAAARKSITDVFTGLVLVAVSWSLEWIIIFCFLKAFERGMLLSLLMQWPAKSITAGW